MSAKSDKPLVVLRGIKRGNVFYSRNSKDSDPRLSATGEIWYEVLGFANNSIEALTIIAKAKPFHRALAESIR